MDNGQYGNGCTSVCGLQVQWMYALQDQITGAREIKGNPVRASHTLLFIVLLVFSLCASGWSACHSYGSTIQVEYTRCQNQAYNACRHGTTCPTSWDDLCSKVCQNACAKTCPETYTANGVVYSGVTQIYSNLCTNQESGCASTGYSGLSTNCKYAIQCDTQAEADSAKCALNPSSPGCKDGCADMRKQCEGAGGVFSGSAASGCCKAVCNVCKNFQKLVNIKQQQCCDQGLAPPDSMRGCQIISRETCGMNWSTFNTRTTPDYSCQDPSLDSTVAKRYLKQCFDYEEDEDPGSSSSGDGSSSSGDGSSSSGDGGSSGSGDMGCQECPWLDSILDTLTAQKHQVDNIYLCVTIPSLCADEQEKEATVDSALARYVFPGLDSLVRLDSSQVRILMRLDSNTLRALRNDSAALDNDTMIYRSITDAGYTNDTNLIELRGRVFRMDTAMRHRLDSLIKSLPKDVLDSIVKYQDSTMDRIDSALWGKGVGFSLIDSLVDSTVKYFKVSNHYDSVYNVMFHDFDSTFKYKMENLEVSVESDYAGLGYGDTATSTLRKDLSDMKEAITSAISDIDGSVTGSLDGLKDAIDGLGGGNAISSFDSAIAANGGGAVDTSGVYLDIYGGELLADSIARDVGYDKIDVARDTAAMDSVLALDYTETDSTLCVGSECVSYDSDAKIADSAQRYIARQGDSIRASNQAFYKDSVDSYFQQVKDTLTKWNPFGMFDSTLMKTLGAKVPNSNTCPEHCSKYRVEVPFIFGNLGIDLDWQLCASWAVLGGQNVMSFLRFIIRVIVAVTCIAMIMRAAANTKVR